MTSTSETSMKVSTDMSNSSDSNVDATNGTNDINPNTSHTTNVSNHNSSSSSEAPKISRSNDTQTDVEGTKSSNSNQIDTSMSATTTSGTSSKPSNVSMSETTISITSSTPSNVSMSTATISSTSSTSSSVSMSSSVSNAASTATTSDVQTSMSTSNTSSIILPPSVNSETFTSTENNDIHENYEIERSVQTHLSQQHKIHADYAVSLQVSIQLAQEEVVAHEKYRQSKGAEQDRVFVVYWQAWHAYIRDAYRANDRLLDFFWQRSLVDDQLANELERIAAPLTWYSAEQTKDTIDTNTMDQTSQSTNLPATAPHVTHTSQVHDTTASGRRMSYSGEPQPSQLVPTPDGTSSFVHATHMIADVHAQLARSLRKTSQQLRHQYFGIQSKSKGNENVNSSCLTPIGEYKPSKTDPLLRPWLKETKMKQSNSKKSSTNTEGTLLTMRREYRDNVDQILAEGDIISNVLKSVNAYVTTAYQEFQTVAEETIVACTVATSNGNDAAKLVIQSVTENEEGSASNTRRPSIENSEFIRHGKRAAQTLLGNYTHGNSSGERDVVFAYIKYSRTLQALLQTKRSFMLRMSRLFDQFKEAEKVRTQAIQECASKYLQWTERQNHVLGINARASFTALRLMNTHADFKHFIAQAVETHAKLSHTHSVEQGDEDTGTDSTSNNARERPYELHTTALSVLKKSPPPVHSPLLCPLVYKWGRLSLRTGGMLRRWQPMIALLSRTGILYLFDPDNDDICSTTQLLQLPICPQPNLPLPDTADHETSSQQSNIETAERQNNDQRKNVVSDAYPNEIEYSDGIEKLETEHGLTWAKQAGKTPNIILHIARANYGQKLQHSHTRLLLQFRADIDKAAFEIGTIFPSMLLFSTTNKHILKASSEDEMLEWAIALNNVSDCASATAMLASGDFPLRAP